MLRTTKGEGGGAPGAVLDDNLTIACGEGAVRIVELQKAGGKPMHAEEFLRGTPVRAGLRARLTPCPATRSSSNTTARRSPAGSTRRTRRRCSARIMEAIAAFTGENVMVQGAGRTDAGVHALGQVAHFDLAMAARHRHHPRRASTRICGRIRSRSCRQNRSRAISMRAAPPFAGTISTASSTAAPISPSTAAAPGGCRGGSITRRCTQAAQRLIGKHDFTTFRSTECQAKSPEKTLDRLDVSRAGDEVHVTAVARSFLHNQVRSMVGSLVLVGDGKWSADDVSRALDARDRSACGPVAPPDGLYLVQGGLSGREPMNLP